RLERIACKARVVIQQQSLGRIESRFMMSRRPEIRSSRLLEKLDQLCAQETSALDDGFHGRYQLASRCRLQQVAGSRHGEGRADDVSRLMLADEQNPAAGAKRTDSSSRLNAIELRQADVQQDEVRRERLGFLDRFVSVRGFSDDLPARMFPQRRTNVTAPGL